MRASKPLIILAGSVAAVASVATVGALLMSGRPTPAELLDQARSLLVDDGGSRDVAKAIPLLEQVANSNDPANAREAALELVAHYEQLDGNASSQASARQWRLRAAECGDRSCAEAMLADMLQESPLSDQAERVARAGARAGSPYCMLVLGDLLAQGRGTVTQDLKGAKSWYRKADEAGEPRGNARLALMMLDDPEQQAECLSRLVRAGESGDVECAFQGAMRLLAGSASAEPDVARAVPLLERGVAAGHASSCREFALLLADGVKIPRDLARARALRQIAAPEDPRSAFEYAQMCELGIGGPVDVHTAMAHYAHAAKGGVRGSYLRMGVLCQEGRPGLPPDPEQAEIHLRAASDGGDNGATWRLSRLLIETGRGGDEAFELSARAARARQPGALYDQYWFLLKGNAHQTADRIAAVESLRAATEENFPEAWYRLGVLLADGAQGVIGNTKDAADAFHKAYELDVPVAALQLGALYQLGLDAPPDQSLAAAEYLRAAERGITEAQFRLGLMHEFGTGVPADQEQAYRWYHLASADGDQRAVGRRAHLRTKMLNQTWQALEDTAPELLLADPAQAKRYQQQSWSPLDRRAGRTGPSKGEGFAGREFSIPSDRPASGGGRGGSGGSRGSGTRRN